MSTEFRTAASDTWVCTRWAKRTALDAGCMAFDFGSAAQFSDLENLALSEMGDLQLLGEDGTRTTLFDLLVAGTSSALMGRRLAATFGESCGVVAVGDGELLDRLGLTGLDAD